MDEMTYKVVIYGKKMETEDFEDLQELINEVHYLLECKLGKEKISGIYVGVK